MMSFVTVVGGGLAGVEAAWQCARRGVPVRLVEMRPRRMTAAHRTGLLAELVCSNSFKTAESATAPGLLKEEMRTLASLVLTVAAATRVAAGGALAVDRRLFARRVTDTLEGQTAVEVVREEVTTFPPPPAVIATGPLSSAAMAAELAAAVGRKNLFFYDALAPVVARDSIDVTETFSASRYDKGGGGYLNCPLTRGQYRDFVAALAAAETAPRRDFEDGVFFESCLPLEELARRGEDTLRFGPMKPVGLVDPRRGARPYAVLQLRPEDDAETMFGLVGCQTRLKRPEQRRVFRMIPALAKAEFLRYGAAHRNTYICSPAALGPTLEMRFRPGVFIAGQLTGVEGYMESAATGIIAGINLARLYRGRPPVYPPGTTAIGALLKYISSAPASTFAPMNINFGLFPPVSSRGRKGRREEVVARARRALAGWLQEVGEGV